MSEQQPTPVTEDADATARQLLNWATVDYARAQARRDRLSQEDRVRGNEPGGTH